MKLSSNDIFEMIKKKLPDAKIHIEDLRGDSDHYHATIESKNLKGYQKFNNIKLFMMLLVIIWEQPFMHLCLRLRQHKKGEK